MEMKKTYKRVPFDIETAKKITNGEVKGKILKKELKPDMFPVRFICFNSKVKGYPYIVLEYNPFCNNESVAYYENEDVCKRELIIELPEEAPKHEFKPFDKVIVWNKANKYWFPTFYAQERDGYYETIDGKLWLKCVQYEGNEHLVGTTDNPE